MSIPYWICVFNVLKFGVRVVSQPLESYKALVPSEKAYWNATVVSSLHAVWLVVNTWVSIRDTPSLLTSTSIGHTTPQLSETLNMFLGYLLYDLVGVVRFFGRWRGSKLMLIHHLTAIFMWSLMVYYQKGHSLALYAQLCEFTTPFINNRWFLKQFHRDGGNIGLSNRLIIFISWIVFRLGLFGYGGTQILYKLYHSYEDTPVLLGVSLVGNFVVGYSLQWTWFMKMVNIVKNMVRKSVL